MIWNPSYYINLILQTRIEDFNSRLEEHIKKDNKSHVFKYLRSTTAWFSKWFSAWLSKWFLKNEFFFKIIHKANSKFDLKTKETWHISWSQQNNLALTLWLWFVLPLFFLSVVVYFPLSFIYYFHFLWH